MNSSTLPQHVAIIMDGNGRWAQARGYPRFYGHIRGTARVKEIVRAAREMNIPALTLYAFSTENWKRPEAELNVLWTLLKKYLRREIADLEKNGIRLRVIGDWKRLPEGPRQELEAAIERLKSGQKMELTFALSYGARQELVDACKRVAARCVRGEITVEQIQDSDLEQELTTAYLGDRSNVDFLIRTSGEKRLSNFLLWQCSYAEFEFPEVLWPDYSVEHFKKSLDHFSQRKRRFGGI